MSKANKKMHKLERLTKLAENTIKGHEFYDRRINHAKSYLDRLMEATKRRVK